MSSRALEIVRVLCMHMGDIIFFIAYAWPTRGDTPHPPPCHLICVSFCTTHPKKKKNGQKNENPLWFLAITRQQCHAYRWQQSMAYSMEHRQACSHATHTHTCTHTQTETVSEWSYIYAHIARQRSATHIHFSNAFLIPGNSLPALSLSPAVLLLPFPLFHSFSFSFLSCESFNHIRHITQNAKHGGLTK